MKKNISILLAIVMIASLATAAFADAEYTDFESIGIAFTAPEGVDAPQGVLYPYPQGAVSFDPHIYIMPVYYFAMTQDVFYEYMGIEEELLTEEQKASLRAAQNTLGLVVSSDGDRDTTLSLLFGGEVPSEVEILDVGTADGFSFYYFYGDDADYVASLGEDYAADYAQAKEFMLATLESARLYAPDDPLAVFIGRTFHFETTDVYGNPCTSEELFAANEITMINYWGTWCYYCVQELGELADIHSRLQEKGCGIIGILQDGYDEKCVEDAKALMTEHGTNYPVLLPTDEMDEILEDVTSFPMTFFVDKSGTIIAHPIAGAAVTEYEPSVLALLNGETDSAPTSPAPLANDLNCYRVCVCDTDGKPVKGVTIQFCSDDACNLAKTDDDGIARFDLPEGLVYTVHTLKVPAGYVKDTTEYETLDVYSDVKITLEKDA